MVKIRISSKVMIGVLAVLVAAWAVVVWQSGRGWNPFNENWDFENTGQIGDSFGILSAMMAAGAAYFAYQTYLTSREEIRHAERRALESSFLNLLERRFDVLDRVTIIDFRWMGDDGHVSDNTVGQAAIDKMASDLRARTLPWEDEEGPDEQFTSAISRALGLPNLFRFTYHLISFVDVNLGDSIEITKSDTRYQYVRILRAQLSNSELLLIALNCIYGEGRKKFRPLVEKYALLHNLPFEDVNKFQLVSHFQPSAFGLLPEDRHSRDSFDLRELTSRSQ